MFGTLVSTDFDRGTLEYIETQILLLQSAVTSKTRYALLACFAALERYPSMVVRSSYSVPAATGEQLYSYSVYRWVRLLTIRNYRYAVLEDGKDAKDA